METDLTKSVGSVCRRFAGMFKALVAMAAFALAPQMLADTAVDGGLIWTYTVSSGKATITAVAKDAGGTKPTGAVTIPSTLNGNTVTFISSTAFSGCTGVTSVTIPNTITAIDGFSGCTGLQSVSLPANTTRIANSAFKGCWSLKSITIPANADRKSVV